MREGGLEEELGGGRVSTSVPAPSERGRPGHHLQCGQRKATALSLASECAPGRPRPAPGRGAIQGHALGPGRQGYQRARRRAHPVPGRAKAGWHLRERGVSTAHKLTNFQLNETKSGARTLPPRVRAATRSAGGCPEPGPQGRQRPLGLRGLRSRAACLRVLDPGFVGRRDGARPGRENAG